MSRIGRFARQCIMGAQFLGANRGKSRILQNAFLAVAIIGAIENA